MIVDAEDVSGKGFRLEGDELEDESKKDNKSKDGGNSNFHNFDGFLHYISVELSIWADNGLDIVLVDDRKTGVTTLESLFDVSHIVDHWDDTSSFGKVVAFKLKSVLLILSD